MGHFSISVISLWLYIIYFSVTAASVGASMEANTIKSVIYNQQSRINSLSGERPDAGIKDYHKLIAKGN